MKKIFLTLAATAMCATTFAAVGDVTTVLDQTFEEGTTLTNGTNYSWGSDIQGMITNDGLLMTNADNAANNYENRPFLTFPNTKPIGSETQEVNISYELFNAKGFGQAPAYFSINYFDGKNKFLFGIKESIGNWENTAAIITANEDGSTTETPLSAAHVNKTVDLTVKFSGSVALIELDGASYSAYSNKAGILAIKLSVSGDRDWNRGLNIKNFIIKTTEVQAAQLADYTLKYVCGSEVLKTVQKSGEVGTAIVITDADKEAIWNEDKSVKYIFSSDDATGKTIAAGEVITLTYRQAATWDYTVANNVNEKTTSGTCIEGESVTVPFSIYALAADGTVWTKDHNATNPWFGASFTPDANNYVENIEYKETDKTTGLYFIEAEKLPGLTATSANNADIRCSNQAAGYIEVAEGEEATPVEICKLGKGTYTVETAVWGGKNGADTNITAVIKAGNKTVLELTTTGSWTTKVSDEFVIDAKTSLTVEGPIKNQPIDFFLVCGSGEATDVKAVETVKGDNKWYNLQGVQIAEPTQGGLYIHNGKKVIVK